MNRNWKIARLHLVPWPSARGMPWAILAFSFAVNLLIYSLLSQQDRANGATGGLLSIYVLFLIVHLRAMVQVFPFALGLNVTRRRFYAVAATLAVVEALGYGVVLTLLKLAEQATGGWGVSLRFFGISWLVQDNPLVQIAVYTGPFLLLGFVGMFVGLVFKRWGVNGMYTLSVFSLLVFGGLAAIVTWQHQWVALGDWFADQPAPALFTGWPALLAVVLAAAGFATIRRTVP